MRTDIVERLQRAEFTICIESLEAIQPICPREQSPRARCTGNGGDDEEKIEMRAVSIFTFFVPSESLEKDAIAIAHHLDLEQLSK